MDTKQLQKEVNQIKMSTKMEKEILSNCLKKMEEQHMSKNNIKKFRVKPLAAVAALALCLCVTGITSMAATGKLEGFFRDIKNWTGAVTGTAYEQATDEVLVAAAVSENEMVVTLTLAEPDEAPYAYFDTMGIETFQVKDAKGNVVMEGFSNDAQIVDGTVILKMDASNWAEGEYTLFITELVGKAKAEQPLILSGDWECKIEY